MNWVGELASNWTPLEILRLLRGLGLQLLLVCVGTIILWKALDAWGRRGK